MFDLKKFRLDSIFGEETKLSLVKNLTNNYFVLN